MLFVRCMYSQPLTIGNFIAFFLALNMIVMSNIVPTRLEERAIAVLFLYVK